MNTLIMMTLKLSFSIKSMLKPNEHASCLNAVKRFEAVVEANGGYIEDK